MEYWWTNLKDKHKTLLAILIEMSEADMHFHKNEFLFIKELGESFNLSDEEIESLVEGSIPSKIKIPKSEEERLSFFIYALTVMTIDDRVHEKEIKYGKQIALMLGIRNEMADNLIEHYIKEVEEYGVEGVSVEDIVLRFLN